MSSKVIFVGDLHLSSQTPISRKETNEQWMELQLQKLKSIYDYAEQIEAKSIIYAGDIFNSCSINTITGKFLTEIIYQFRRLKSFSIIGNHDMYFRNEEMFKYTILNLMFQTETLYHLDTLYMTGEEGKDVLIQGTDYLHDIPKVEKDRLSDCDYYISVSHQLYENADWGTEANSNLSYIEVQQKGYNAYFMGHDHANYQPILVDDKLILRPRSIVKGDIKIL